VILIFVDIENPRGRIEENQHDLCPDLLPNLKTKRYLKYDSQSKMFWNQLLVDYLPRKHMISQSENTVEMIPI